MTLCAFNPFGRQCSNPAAVTVTLTGCGLPAEDVPTCGEHVHDWLDEVAATARPISAEPATPQPATEPATG